MKHYTVRELCAGICAATCGATTLISLILLPVPRTLAATSSDFAAVPLTSSVSVKPNILFILDNSNSMDEDVDGKAVGSDNPTSRSEIARNTLKTIIDTYKGSMRFGLMAYDQITDDGASAATKVSEDAVRPAALYNSFYYASFDPSTYDPNGTPTPKDPKSNTQRIQNPTDITGNYIYYDTAMPFYDDAVGTNILNPVHPNQFCYSYNYTEGHDSSNDTYNCYANKIWIATKPTPTPPVTSGTETASGYSNLFQTTGFVPTDDDFAAGFTQFGYENASIYVGPTWFSNKSPGGGRLHINIDDSTDAHIAEFYDTKGFQNPIPANYNPNTGKLGRAQFVTATDTPLRNAGLTPLAGTFATALNYFSGQSTKAAAGVTVTNPITAPCQQNFIILITDGLPSTNSQGVSGNAAELLPEVQQNIKNLADGVNNGGVTYKIKTFVIGLAMGQNGDLLNPLAIAGGTGTPYYADNQNALNNALTAIFQQISAAGSCGTAAAVNTNSRSGEGGVFPTMFYPQKQDVSGRTIYWAGDVSALFIDQYGRLREDSNQNGILDDNDTNPDQADQVVIYQPDPAGNVVGFATPVGAKTEITTFTVPSASTLAGNGGNKYFFINASNGRGYYVCFKIDNAAVDDATINGTTTGASYRQRLQVTLASGDDANTVAQKIANVLANTMVFTAKATGNSLTVETVLPGDVADMAAKNSGVTNISITQQGSAPDATPPVNGKPEEIKYIWKASDWLSAISDSDIIQQRSWPQSPDQHPANQRYIFTFLDKYKNGIPSDGEVVPFVAPSSALTANDLNLNNGLKLYPFIPVSWNSDNINEVAPANGAAYMQAQIVRVINFIRGQDQKAVTTGGLNLPAFRSRQIDPTNSDAPPLTWRLGDIVHSNPLVIDHPNRGYHQTYTDTSYAQFAAKYANRRTVIYTGANDGMLHAFNGGFYENRYAADYATGSTNNPVMRYLTQPLMWDDSNPRQLVPDTTFNNYPLGAELWAYVPYNLLAHLYWLTETSASDPTIAPSGSANDTAQVNHVYYVDLPPVSYDVQMFTADADHPGGWGTILVGGMGFGGGRIDACVKRDWTAGGSCQDSRPMSSAYFIFDITNPEQPPKLLAEFALPRQGYTTNVPALAYFSDKADTSNNRAFLVFGSGPASADGKADTAALQKARSGQPGRVFYLRLPSELRGESLSSASDWGLPNGGSLSASACRTDSASECSAKIVTTDPAYISDMISIDRDLDYKTDTLYYGTVITKPADTQHLYGSLQRILTHNDPTAPSSWKFSTLIDLSTVTGLYQPISAAPNAAFDPNGNLYVYFGTGRYLMADDKTNNDQQAFYGIKDLDSGNGTYTANYDLLRNSTNDIIQTNSDGSVQVKTGGDTLTWPELLTKMDGSNVPGWVYNLGLGERAVNQPAVTNQLFLATSFVPTTDVCNTLGLSYLYALYYRTGTATVTQLSLGSGLATGLTILGSGDNTNALITTGSGGALLFNVNNELGGALQNEIKTEGASSKSRRLNWQDMSDQTN